MIVVSGPKLSTALGGLLQSQDLSVIGVLFDVIGVLFDVIGVLFDVIGVLFDVIGVLLLLFLLTYFVL